MTRHAARSASAAALVVLALAAGCSPAPAQPAIELPSSPTRTIPPSLPRELAEMWAEQVDQPKQTVSAEDLCELLTAAEITEALGVEVVDGLATGPTKCAWPIVGATDAQGLPNAGALLTTPKSKAIAWVGKRAVVDGHPARRTGGGDVCVFKVLLRAPAEDADDLPVLELHVVTKGGADDQCPAAESLVSLALSRLPSA